MASTKGRGHFAKKSAPAHQALAVNRKVGLLSLVLLIGCDQAPQGDSPFRHLEAIVQTTKRWLGIEDSRPHREVVDSSELDHHKGRLRRRMDQIRSETVTQAHFRSLMRREISRAQFTKGIHVGAIVLWSKERPSQVIGIAIYSRDGMGWMGESCDHLRVKMFGEQGFEGLFSGSRVGLIVLLARLRRKAG